MKRIFAILSISLLIVCGISPINSYAEGFEFPADYTGTTVTGTIVDCTDTDYAIPGAYIKNSTASNLAVASDDNGMFEYTFTREKIKNICKAADETLIQLTITSIGSKETTIDVCKCNEITKKTKIDLGTIGLPSSTTEIDECIIVASREGLNCSPNILNQLKAKSGKYRKIDTTHEKYFCDIECGTNMQRIPVTADNKNIEEFSEEIYECACLDPNPAQDGITKYEYNENSKSCFISDCDTPKYEFVNIATDQSQNKCNAIECKIENGTGKWTGGVNKWKCTVDKCNDNFIEDPQATTTDKMCVDKDCTSKIHENAENKEQIVRAEKTEKDNKLVCQVKECKDGFKPNANKDGCVQKKKCTPEQAKEHPDASDTEFKNGKCIATECFCGYNLKNGKCDPWANNEACDTKNDPKLPKNAKSGTKACTHPEIQNVATTPADQRKKKKAYCDITECNDYYRQEKEDTPDNKCVSTKGDDCLSEVKDTRAEKAEYKIDKKTNQRSCVITKCKEETKTENGKKKKLIYVPNEAGTACVQSKGECALDQDEHPGGLEGKIKKGKCVPSKCKKGYELKKDKCIELNILSKDDSEKQIAELKDNAEALKKNEQSKENRMLSGAAMGATGIGGMQLASALAEQNADEDAEEAMRAYLATFHCNYAPGKNIAGGAKDVELPGGNELIDLLGKYVNLANDLKLRKTALDMKPGIESEPILDTAITGLYDDISVGKISGAYASLARALLDPKGEDAKRWAKQKSDTKTKLITGASIAGVGAVGGLVGDLLINKDSPKNTMKDILAEYEKKKLPSSRFLKESLEILIKDLEDVKQCPEGTTSNGNKCVCNNTKQLLINNNCKTCPDNLEADPETDTCKCLGGRSFNRNEWKCENCPAGQIWSNTHGSCKPCPNQKTNSENNSCVCGENETFDPGSWTCKCTDRSIKNQTGKCELCPNDKTPNADQSACVCTDENAVPTPQTNICECKEGTEKDTNGKCQVKETTTVVAEEKAVLPAAKLFAIDKADVSDDARDALIEWASNIQQSNDCKLTIEGYTDRIGRKGYNETLSTARAIAIRDIIESASSLSKNNITAIGKGEADCNCATVNNFINNNNKRIIEQQYNTINDIDWEDKDYKICKGKVNDTSLLKDKTRYAPCRRVEITIKDCTIKQSTAN